LKLTSIKSTTKLSPYLIDDRPYFPVGRSTVDVDIDRRWIYGRCGVDRILPWVDRRSMSISTVQIDRSINHWICIDIWMCVGAISHHSWTMTSWWMGFRDHFSPPLCTSTHLGGGKETFIRRIIFVPSTPPQSQTLLTMCPSLSLLLCISGFPVSCFEKSSCSRSRR